VTVRVVLTTCMKACPDNAITVCVQLQQGANSSLFLQAAVDDTDAASELVLNRIKAQ
jgi:hypothetical protein